MIKLFNNTAYRRVYTLADGSPFTVEGFSEGKPFEKSLLSEAIVSDIHDGKLTLIDIPKVQKGRLVSDIPVSSGGSDEDAEKPKIKGGKK